jgi:hypothetical protein
MTEITFIVAHNRYPSGNQRYTLYRINGNQRGTISHFENLDAAQAAAERHAARARASGHQTRVAIEA